MAYFNICPLCGATLDPGEVCDCRERSEKNAKKWEQLTRTEEDGQTVLLPPAESKGEKAK